MSVDTATVAKIARLARIAMRDDEVEAMVPELNFLVRLDTSSKYELILNPPL